MPKFTAGQSGNPAGRPRGLRSKATLALEALFEGEAEEIGRQVIKLAKEGDGTALRIFMDRFWPPRKDRAVPFDLPPIDQATDLPKATGALLSAVAQGWITPSEATEIGRVFDIHIRAVEANDLGLRLAKLEAAALGGDSERSS